MTKQETRIQLKKAQNPKEYRDALMSFFRTKEYFKNPSKKVGEEEDLGRMFTENSI